MNEIFVRAFKDELQKIAKLGMGKKLLLGAGALGLGGTTLASHAAAKGWKKGEIEATETARRRRAMGF